MAEPWIRVHANIAEKRVAIRASEHLKVSLHEAIGLLVQFWGAMSRLGDDGVVISLSDREIEKWAGWQRKRGAFAAFIREFHTDDDGRVNEWDEYAGALEDRRAKDRDRQRRKREERRKLRGASRGQSGDSHAERPQTVAPIVGGSSADDHVERPRDVTQESVPARAVRNDTKRDTTRETTRSKATNSRDEAAGDLNGAEKPARETWLTPICAAWETANGAGTFATIAKQAAHAISPLVKAGHHPPTIARHLENYLAETEPAFHSITRFAQTFAQWSPKQLVDEHGFLTPEGLAAARK